MNNNYLQFGNCKVLNIKEMIREFVIKLIHSKNYSIDNFFKEEYKGILIVMYSDYLKYNKYFDISEKNEKVENIKTYEDLIIEISKSEKKLLIDILNVSLDIYKLDKYEKAVLLTEKIEGSFSFLEELEELVYSNAIDLSKVLEEIQIIRNQIDLYTINKYIDGRYLKNVTELIIDKVEYLIDLMKSLIVLKYYNEQYYLELMKQIIEEAMYLIKYEQNINKSNKNKEELYYIFLNSQFEDLLEIIIYTDDCNKFIEILDIWSKYNSDQELKLQVDKISQEEKELIRKRVEKNNL
ncbi:MAG: hypothetical protein R3Y13_00495 [bacterium]